MVNDTYNEFEIGKTYIGKDNISYTILSIDLDFITAKMNNVIKKFRYIEYCGVYACLNQGEIVFLSNKITPIYDDSNDDDKQIKPLKMKIGRQYVKIFKKTRNRT